MADHAAVTFLLEQVTEVIRGYADLISSADKEFKKLKEDVEELKGILKDTSSTSTEGKSVRLIKNQIRDVVYEVEDAIDTWLTESKAKHRLMRGAAGLTFARKVKTLRVGQVKEMLQKANEMKTALKSAGTNKEAEVLERRKEDLPIRIDKVVGLKDEEEKIKGYLMTDQHELDVIPIIGMPGLGKTTLTWKIYNDQKICYDFPIRIWVHFSQRFNSKEVLIQIMKHFTSQMDELHSMSLRELCNKVHACLSRDKFLLVVDDVWKTEHWDAIKDALPYGNANGKVMITSREMTVGRHVKHITEPHAQRPLNREESWELLQLEVFGRLGNCPNALQGIGNVIAEKCKGVPMTIVVLGGVLKDQYLSLKSDALVREKWNEVAENENLALEDKKQVIVDIVALSYHRLPERLRDCFLYLGVFPAGYPVQTLTLMYLWISEGFIQPDGKRSLEKIAEDNLNDLISRNLLMVQKTNAMREVKVCRVHDIIRMFCADEAEKQNLFRDVKPQEENTGAFKASDMETIRRLCLHSDLDKFFSAKLKGDRVRSFLCFRKDDTDLKAENVSAIYENFVNLRILQSKSIKFKKFPPKLIKLNHLRYIVLCVPEVDTLPDQISQLWNMQTIIVHTNSESLTMKASLWKMIRVRHIKTKAAIVLEKKYVEGDQGGANLQTLNRLSPESVKEVSERAVYLKTLGVRGKLASLFNDMPLGNMKHLEKLKLYQAAASENRLPRLPDSSRFPPNLKRLTLSKTFLEWKHMSTLANILDLEVLKLKDNAFIGIQWDVPNNGFLKLQVLHILNSDLVIWTASESAFPTLRHLELKNCENLNGIPEGILQRLENLDIGRVRKSITDPAKHLKVQIKLGADLIA
ncbi:hypothetical protein ACS0TY_007142 [Phlomoides rotata]